MDTRFQHLGFAASASTNMFGSKAVQVEEVGADYGTDLWLDSPGSSLSHFSTSKGTKRKWSLVIGSMRPEETPSPVLGLSCSPSYSDCKGRSAKETEKSSMNLSLGFDLHLGNEKSLEARKSANTTLKVKPKFDLELSLSTGPAESDITSVSPGYESLQNNLDIPLMVRPVPLINERSAPSLWKLQNAVPPLHISPITETTPSIAAVPELSSTVASKSKSSITCTSRTTQQQRSSSTKMCQFKGCAKGARGASGLCIAHGGGRRCQKLGCQRGAEGRTAFCKGHGGGRRCQFLGCTKSAEGRTDHCITHGGGRRCSHEGCTKAARGKSGLCIRHGGGKRCQNENCSRSAEGFSGFCISHGGGRRCQFPECKKGAQGSTMLCKAHGGGKRCTFLGCTKGAEGSTPFCKGHGGGKRCTFQGGGVCTKSVHGGTHFCVAHGGGKRCAILECTKSARGRTAYCVRHGGGKRCKSEGCDRSAQGSTDFCKAHGGGKRCSWGQPGSEYAGQAPAAPCDRFARGKIGLCTAHSALVQDNQVHGGGTLGPTVPNQPKKMKGVVAIENMNLDIMKMGHSRNDFSGSNGFGSKGSISHQFLPLLHFPNVKADRPPCPVSLPEGRVHGGSLMEMLANNTILDPSLKNQVLGGDSEPGSSYTIPHNWI